MSTKKNDFPKNFKRRKFIKTLTAGTALISGAGCLAFSARESKQKTIPPQNIINKVKKAMLSMQRAPWEQGVAAQAFLEYGDLEMTYLLAKEAVLRQAKDGRLAVLYSDNGVTDPAASGEVVLRMAQQTGESEFAEANKRMLDYLMNKAPRSKDGILYHIMSGPEFWIDSMYMAPPYICVAGQHQEAVKQVEGLRKALWNRKAQLFSHRWDNEKKMFPNKKFWGVGNGWALAGIARIADDLPGKMSNERNKLIGYAKANLEGCLKYLRPDGLFHNIIDEPNTFVETNLSQMVAYTIYRGIKSGWLSNDYLEKADKMRKATHLKVDEHGYVQGVCSAPYFDSPGRATEGQAFFILMEAARKKLNS